jgi:hypothetical protein
MSRLAMAILFTAAVSSAWGQIAPPSASSPAPPPPPIIVPGPGGAAVQVPPGAADRNNFSDRIERCIHSGAAAGIGPNDLGQFSTRCAN